MQCDVRRVILFQFNFYTLKKISIQVFSRKTAEESKLSNKWTEEFIIRILKLNSNSRTFINENHCIIKGIFLQKLIQQCV